MPLTEATAGAFGPDQAADLLRLLEAVARWEGLRASPTWHDPAGGAYGLRSRQWAYDQYRAELTGYEVRYGADHSAGAPGGTPARLAAWCRAVRAVCLRAGAGDAPTALVQRGCVAAERLGTRLGAETMRPELPDDVQAAAGLFEGLAVWCNGLTGGREKRAA